MPTLNVYLCNRGNVSTATLNGAIGLLNGFFARVVRGSGFAMGSVSIAGNASQVVNDGYNLLCYISETQQDNVMTAFNGRAALSPSHMGLTSYITGATPDRACAEVYMNLINQYYSGQPALGLANTIFHELMHNKSCGDPHHEPGVSVGRAITGLGTTFNERDAAFMRRHLRRRVIQWLGGFDVQIIDLSRIRI